MNTVYVVGIGDDGMESLPDSARRRLEEAELLVGTERTLAMIPSFEGECLPVETDLGDMVRRIEKARVDRKIVVLASGDPMFYGVARYLVDRLGKESFEVLPHVSSMQLAFARVKESWDEAYLTNVASQPLETIVDRIRIAEKVGIFTNESVPPSAVARCLLDEGISYFRVSVCENLGAANEVVTYGTLAEISEMEFGPLNVMILIREPDVPETAREDAELMIFGNPDENFRQTRPHRGLLTSAEVRTLALAKLNLKRKSVVWDVGAGSGSVSIETAQLATEGKVYAIEPEVEDGLLIRENAERFGVDNIQIVAQRAPEAFRDLPDADAIFIGGVGRETVGIIEAAFDRLKPGGHLVANVASLENVSAATSTLKALVPHVGILMVNLARGTHQLESIRFEAVNPSFLIFVTKSGA
ncbi:precorrin-6y C5,15-methyltransferase (decarboxylating) subunit CbiE [Kolteria novifilia]|uniref:precorrin-6y C5,15-methyltransferase (decarboxylating) subunit CbiE n=1 Tax=Kolteria novifilia TaxID=2527975 RepID=UPI003AF3768E